MLFRDWKWTFLCMLNLTTWWYQLQTICKQDWKLVYSVIIFLYVLTQDNVGLSVFIMLTTFCFCNIKKLAASFYIHPSSLSVNKYRMSHMTVHIIFLPKAVILLSFLHRKELSCWKVNKNMWTQPCKDKYIM